MEPLKNRKELRALVVDDYLLTREMVSVILRQIGISSIVTAEDGAQALKLIKKNQFDLVVCDWNMPNMNGLEFLKEARQDLGHSEVPFLLLTAEAYKENVKLALEAGVTDYITKPFTAQTLSDKIESAMAKAGYTL